MTLRLPRLFIGSSSETKEIARAVGQNLANDADVVLWPHAFPIGTTALEALLEQVRKSDFAVLVMTPDDITRSRGKLFDSPRDNVVFELGLFTGMLGAERCFGVHPIGADLKYPTDLLGYTTAQFRLNHPNGLLSAVEPACNDIRQRVKQLGLFGRDSHSAFCASIAGFWWEYILPVDISSISFIEMTGDSSHGFKIKGWAHSKNGPRVADWWTEGCGVDSLHRKLFYTWKGNYIHTPAAPFEGYGHFSFDGADGPLARGYGYFAEIDVTDLAKTAKKSGNLYRCTQAETTIMRCGISKKINSLIRKKLRAVV